MFRLPETVNLDTHARLMISKRGAASHLNISVRHLERLLVQGRVLQPTRFGRRVLWPATEFHDWVAAGCPVALVWEARRAGAPAPGALTTEVSNAAPAVATTELRACTVEPAPAEAHLSGPVSPELGMEPGEPLLPQETAPTPPVAIAVVVDPGSAVAAAG